MSKNYVNDHSIWLKPDSKESGRLSELIARFSGAFNSPLFAPHLTLLGQIPGDIDFLLPRFRQLASGLKQLSVTVESIDMHDQFYQAIFYQISQSEELAQMNEKARKLFLHRFDAQFFPHISLLYGSSPAKEKEEVLSRLQIPMPDYIPITHFCLMQTQGEVEDWTLIEEIALK